MGKPVSCVEHLQETATLTLLSSLFDIDYVQSESQVTAKRVATLLW
jgi:hypothetical protein